MLTQKDRFRIISKGERVLRGTTKSGMSVIPSRLISQKSQIAIS